jgi:hypothetical protein
MGPVAFSVIAALAIGSALGLILKRNAIHGALFLVVNLACVAVCYLVLRAEFLAAAQVIVYAGAIMVLFVFAIMVLIPGKEETGGGRTGWSGSRSARCFSCSSASSSWWGRPVRRERRHPREASRRSPDSCSRTSCCRSSSRPSCSWRRWSGCWSSPAAGTAARPEHRKVTKRGR